VVGKTLVDTQLNVALVIPLQGPLGLISPASELCAQLAAEEINAVGGILGQELRLITVDGGADPELVAADVEALVSQGLVQAVIGTHTSAVRRAVVPQIADRVPYVYTSLYEGGERNPGVFLTGETPELQLLPGMRLLAEERHVQRWYVVGNDYIWPRKTAAVARRYARESGGAITGETYVPLGTMDFTTVVDSVALSDVDAVLVLLVGEDAVHFHRAFAERDLHRRYLRLTPLMDENMLLAAGAESTTGLFATAGYFETLTTPERLDFAGRYARRFGVDAPTVGNLGESCYEGVRLLDALMRQARSPDVHAITAVADTVSYEGARGVLHLRDRHAAQRIYLAEAEALEFAVVAELPPPHPRVPS
jgi:ABC-type branched-subunit amino acid transport system substrate-binding protein